MAALRGKVTKIVSVSCDVHSSEGVYRCALRRRISESDTGQSNPLAVGDEVEFEPVGEGEGVIERVLPRRTKLSRAHPHDPRIEKVTVANVDQLLIVASVACPPLSLRLIDRCIIAGLVGGLEPVVCINKIDLAAEAADYEDAAGIYRELGYRAVTVSALTGMGVEQVREALRDKSTVLAGHSGTGKSALINAVQPGAKLKTGDVRKGGKGRHTTSVVSLIELRFGGYVVDTPGIREFSLWDVEKRDVAQFFDQIWELSRDCKMPDCLHICEPHCAVREALEAGELPKVRYESYCRIVESIEEPSAPRDTDVERPQEQIKKEKRRESRRGKKERFRKKVGEELDEMEQPGK